MKVAFNYQLPFMLAHGGLQTQIQQTMTAVQSAGAEVEALRWWDEGQTADVLHCFGRVSLDFLMSARLKGVRVVQAELLTEQGARPKLRLRSETLIRAALRRFRAVRRACNWDSYMLVDASLANTEWEARLMKELYGAPAGKVHVVPNGVEQVFLQSRAVPRGEWLVCTATITQRKGVLELAEAAVQAQTPLWVIGKPYSETDDYGGRFLAFAAAHPELLRYQGPLNDRARLAEVYREARGFVLLSTMETRSLAAEEAAACECPLLLSELPWARSVFGERAAYAAPGASKGATAERLRWFYDAAPQLPVPPTPISWLEVGRQLCRIYAGLSGSS